MQAQEIDHMFNLPIEKTSKEIIDAAHTKTKALISKTEERQKRIAALRAEHGIDDAALVQLLTAARRAQHTASTSYSYTSRASLPAGGDRLEERTIGAGVVNNLLTESDFIEAERAHVKRLGFVIRKTWDYEGASKIVDVHPEMPRSAGLHPLGIIGVARVVDAIDVDAAHDNSTEARFIHDVRNHLPAGLSWDNHGRWMFGPWGWVLDNVVGFEVAVPCRGAQGLWTLPADVLGVVRERWANARVTP